MPIYEYGCSQCGEVTEKLQSSPKSPTPERCPHCEAIGTLKRMMSNTSFKLKGGGWYVTDYAKPSQPSAKGESSEGGEAQGGAAKAPESGESQGTGQGSGGGSTEGGGAGASSAQSD